MVDQLSGTGYDTSFMMLNFNESIGVRKIYFSFFKTQIPYFLDDSVNCAF
jgi:hypothetical protein